MKIQDIFFIVLLLILIALHRPRLFIIVGLLCLVASIPLFSFWIFFTAQRLVYYAVWFLIIGIAFYTILYIKKSKS